jgi:hypothetical protein
MALQLGALREALIDAGASQETASRAAEELAGHEREFTGLRSEISKGFAGVDQEFAKIRGDINLLRWMVGANFALTLAVFVKLFIR